MTPDGVIRPILFPTDSLNHRLPSAPAVMVSGEAPGVGIGNSVMVMTADGVIWAILLAARSTNQRWPSGPAAMPCESLDAVGIGNSVMTPAVVIRPILLPPLSVTHRLLSGPVVMPSLFDPEGMGNSVMTPPGVMRP